MGLGKKGLCHTSRVTVLEGAEGNASLGCTRSFLASHGTVAQRSACLLESNAQLEASLEAHSGENSSARCRAPGMGRTALSDTVLQ